MAQTVKASTCNVGGPGSIPGLGRSPGEGNDNNFLVLLPRKFHGWRSLVGYSPWGTKELDLTERLQFLSFQMFIKLVLILAFWSLVQNLVCLRVFFSPHPSFSVFSVVLMLFLVPGIGLGFRLDQSKHCISAFTDWLRESLMT